MADDTAYVEISGKIDGLIEATNQVKEQLTGLKEKAEEQGEMFGKLGERIREAFEVAAIIEFIEKMNELGLQTERTMAMLGLTSEQVGEMSGIAKLTGTSLETMTLGIERMSLNIQRANRDAFSPQAQALKVLGLNAREFQGLRTDQYFDKLNEAVSKFSPSLNLTNALMEIGGRGVGNMIPMLNLSKEHWDEFKKAIDETGTKLSDITAHDFAEAHVKMTLLGLTLEGLGVAIYEKLQPAVSNIVEQLREMVAEIQKSIRAGGDWAVLLDGVSIALKSIATLLAGVSTMIRFLSVELHAFWDTTADNGEAVAKQLTSDLNKISEDFKKTFESIWGEAGGVPHITINRQTAGAMNLSAKDQVASEAAAIMAEVDIVRAGYAQIKLIYETDVATFGMTKIEELNALKAYIDQHKGQETDLLAARRDLYVQGTKEWQQAENERVKATQRENLEVLKLDKDLAKERSKEWQSSIQGLVNDFDSQLKGLLNKTTTWGQAMKNIAADIVLQMIKEFEKLALVNPLVNALKDFTPPAEFFAQLFKMIMAGVAQVFSGVAGFLAPVLGPAAPAAAAGVAAGVESAAMGMIPKAERGAWEVAGGPWFLHPGETVLPAPAAQAFRNMAEGNATGGGGDHIHLHLVDTSNAMAFIQKYAREIVSATNQYRKLNPRGGGL